MEPRFSHAPIHRLRANEAAGREAARFGPYQSSGPLSIGAFHKQANICSR
jgi:hypothetical protein